MGNLILFPYKSPSMNMKFECKWFIMPGMLYVFQAQYIFLHQSTLELLNNKGNSQSIWFVSYSALEKLDSLDAMEGKLQ